MSSDFYFLTSELCEPRPYIRCLVVYYGIMDLEPMRKDRPAITDEVNKEFSTLHRLKETRSKFPPMFIARAGREEPALNVAVDSFIQEAVKKNSTVDFSNHPNGQHGFDVLDDNARTREIISRTIEFIKAHS